MFVTCIETHPRFHVTLYLRKKIRQLSLVPSISRKRDFAENGLQSMQMSGKIWETVEIWNSVWKSLFARWSSTHYRGDFRIFLADQIWHLAREKSKANAKWKRKQKQKKKNRNKTGRKRGKKKRAGNMEEPCGRGNVENLISRGSSFESGKFSLGTCGASQLECTVY